MGLLVIMVFAIGYVFVTECSTVKKKNEICRKIYENMENI